MPWAAAIVPGGQRRPQGGVSFPQTVLQRGCELAHATPSGQTRGMCGEFYPSAARR